jgi:HEAT repeat protein
MAPMVYFVLLVGALSAVGLLFARAQGAMERAVFAEAARALRLQQTWGWNLHRAGGLRGRMGPFVVHVRPYARRKQVNLIGRRRRNYEECTLFEVHGVPKHFEFSHQTFSDNVLQFVTGKDFQTGDVAFDDTMLVHGEEKPLRAALNAKTRTLLLQLFSPWDSGGVQNGSIRLIQPVIAQNAGEITGQLRELVALAEHLCAPASTTRDQLAVNAHHDPNPQVRLRALVTLHRYFQGAATEEALRNALRDPSMEVQAAAARTLPSPDTLGALTRNPMAPAAVRADCIRALGPLPDHSLSRDELLELLQDRASLVRQAALRTLPTLDPQLAKTHLTAWPSPQDPAERLALTEAMARVRTQKAEARLITLAADPDRAVRVAAIEGLGEIGTASALPALRVASGEAFGLTEVSDAARAAIERIEGRGRAL